MRVGPTTNGALRAPWRSLSPMAGAHLVGPHVNEVIHLFALAIRHDITAGDLKKAMFAYPTGGSDIGYML